jgi:hypothetical protein
MNKSNTQTARGQQPFRASSRKSELADRLADFVTLHGGKVYVDENTYATIAARIGLSPCEVDACADLLAEQGTADIRVIGGTIKYVIAIGEGWRE